MSLSIIGFANSILKIIERNVLKILQILQNMF